jgi:alanine dehydrogenase
MTEIAERMSTIVGAHYLSKAKGSKGVLPGAVPRVLPDHVLALDGRTSGINARHMAVVPGAAACKLIRREVLSQMKSGSVFVDIAIDQGSDAEAPRPTTHDDPIFLIQEGIHYCRTMVPGAHACTATQALPSATLPYAVKLANVGAERAGIYARSAHGLEHLPGQGDSSRRHRGSRSAFVAESISA